MEAPTVEELRVHADVIAALEDAWCDSLASDPVRRHEEGGWVYISVRTAALLIRRAVAGTQVSIDLSAPPPVSDSVVVATFHTHSNPSAEGWEPGPSIEDERSAWFLGVPCLIRADDGIHVVGPSSRRGGLGGGPGFPP